MKKTMGLMTIILLMAGATFGAQNFVSDEGVVTWSNTSTDVESGQLVDLGDRYGVALVDIASNGTGSVATKGIWSIQRAITNAVSLGALLYYYDADSVTTDATADTYVGECVEAEAVCTELTNSLGVVNKYVKVDLSSFQRQVISGLDTQPYDADLDTLALNNGSGLTNIPASGLDVEANSVSLLDAANYAAMKALLDLEIGTDVQAWDADLDAVALRNLANMTNLATSGIEVEANIKSILDAADYAAVKALLDLEIGTDVQAWDADLDAVALRNLANMTNLATSGLEVEADVKSVLDCANTAAILAALSLEIGTDVEAWDADLDTYAGITPTSYAQTALQYASNSIVINQRFRVTVGEINSGKSLLPAITGKSYRLIDAKAIAYGGAVGTTTTVDLLGTQSAGSVKLVAFGQAGLTQSTVLTAGDASSAVQADGASYTACDAATAITVAKTGGDADTATGVDFIITYVIE